MKTFHGWRIVAAGGTLQFLQSLLLNQSFGVYLAVLVEDRGWSKTAVAAAAALKSTEAAILGPVLGWAVDRFGTQGIVRIGIVTFGIGLMLLSWIDTLLGFYAAFIVVALGSSMFSNSIVGVAIIHWFEKRRARALSALQMGSAVGGLFVFLIAASIQAYGWRATAFASGVIAIVVGWPLARVIRNRDEDLDDPVDGLPVAARDAQQAAAPVREDFSAGEALRTSAFWLIALGHAFSLLVVSAVNVHAVTHIKEGLGYSLAMATLMFTLVTVGQFGGVMLGWTIGDRFRKRIVAAICMLMHSAGLLMLTYATGPVVLAIAALVHGTAWGLRGPFMQAIRADYFGRSSIGMIIGLSSLIIVFGQIGGPILAGLFADWTGDYRMGFTILAALAGLGSLFFLMAKRPTQP
ncbi:MAG TPA: MFS transporter [Burkholderiales bacterium]|nr:MFS transporter [Burkholderiales bacterium]